MNTPFSGGTGADLDEALRWATARLAAAGVPSPRADAELLAAHVLEVSRGRVGALALLGTEVPDHFEELVLQRADRIPLQHLTGRAYFRNLELHVGPGVFVPRPETETLAQLAIDAARQALEHSGRAIVVDLGTGSGAVAASVAAEVPEARVYAVEVSELAAAWAERNLSPWGVELRVGDLRTAYADLEAEFDVVVSNPPYIPPDAVPQEPEVRTHDPQLALYGGGADGMDLPRAVEQSAGRLLRPGGVVAMEHAEVQERLALGLFADRRRWVRAQSHLDLTGRPRCTSAVKV
ncbi:peptide chain release factor N(5)-glutamine methyltransferase [Zhihengliuella flava]|uniref:Release factor glutamine methyltransferase n=1 Tax=Zhihengliuella flava TaxID=1285193 RepID=A0A931GEK5_9MICC|nr:release factor glutamine methyltransferase [Zhihengliuella flava]